MPARIFDGRAYARDIREAAMTMATGKKGTLLYISEEDTPYSALIEKSSRRLGCDFKRVSLDTLSEIPEYATGVLVNHPLPETYRGHETDVFAHLPIEKDVEGMHPYHRGVVQIEGYKRGRRAPFLASAIMDVLYQETTLSGKRVVIINNSPLVGIPLQDMLAHDDATVVVCNKSTRHPEREAQRADILISAVGKEGFTIPGAWIADGAFVIDAGSHYTPKGMVGDVNFKEAQERASFLTPASGGIGPVTLAMFEYTLASQLAAK